MTEADWLGSTDLTAMVDFLREKASNRKLRLFVCACCRRIWRFFKDKRSRKAVEISERYADGKATDEELANAEGDAWDAAGGEGSGSKNEAAAWAASDIEAAVSCGPETAAFANGRVKDAVREILAQCEVLRDIFGNPLCPTSIAPTWLSWKEATIPKLAQAIYDDRAFDRMPILADALEEAGCTNADILAHCRQPGEHVRGCWVVDLLLGKE